MKSKMAFLTLFISKDEKKRGFSLLEVLLSMALVTFFITGLAEIMIYSFQAKKRAETRLKEGSLLASKLETLKSFSFESEELKPRSSSEVICENDLDETFHRGWTIEDISSSLKSVVCEIFPETFPQNKTNLIFLLSRDLGFQP